MSKQESVNMLQIQERFQTDEACREHLFNQRWPDGFICPKCSHKEYYALPKRKQYQCKACKHQTSATAGTVLHKTHTPLRKWFWAIYLASHDKRGVSATRLMDELELTYPTAWLMLHKIREAMSQRDANYRLAGIVELDDSFFGAPTEGGKRGRGTDKTPVIVGVSLDKQGRPLYVKMSVASSIDGETLKSFAKTNIASGSVVYSDALRSYNTLAADYDHKPTVFDLVKNPDHLKWIHTMISNAKAFIAGTYHGLDAKHLQAYLDEFCFRTNRRKFKGQLFNRLLSACVNTMTITYKCLIAELT
jgi:transposase-like protein